MSNRPHRRGRTRSGKVREMLAETDAKAPQIIFGDGKGDGSQLYPVTVGKTVFMVVYPPEGASDDLLIAYSARATANVTGTCPLCGARRHVRGVRNMEFPHETDCPVCDENFIAAAKAFRDQA